MQQYLTFAQTLATQAGDIMLEHFQVGVAKEDKELEGNTPVTIADTAINRMVIEAVSQEFPTHSVIGEEETSIKSEAEYTWVCDPIDGTIPFVMGVPTNVFSLAMVDSSGQPVVAVVHDPYQERMYWAVRGEGASMNGAPIHVNDVNDLSKAYVGASGSRSNTVDPAAFKAEIIARVYRPLMFNSTVYEAMLVATGQMSATMYLGGGSHDVAATRLIVAEAGGRVTDVFGNEQRYDQGVKGEIISNGHVHDALLEIADRHRLSSQ